MTVINHERHLSEGKGGKKLCIITSSFPLSRNDARAAAGLFVRDFSMALAEMGHDVTVVTPDKIPGKKEDVPGVTVHWFPWMGGKKVLAAMKPHRPSDALSMVSLVRSGARFLDRLVSQEPFDHVLAMWAVPAGYLAKGLKKRHGIPFTTWVLGSDIWVYARYPLFKNMIRRILIDSDYLFADGIALAEDVTRLSGRSCPFMASSRRLDRSLIRALDLARSGFRFLFIGRYAEVKGVDILLEAMSEYIQQGSRGHLYMFGGGPLDQVVRERASRQDLRDHVTVVGFANEQTVVSYLDACDCLVIPSRMESIPVILSDAIQMGKPVIVSDVGDMGKLLRRHPAGLVVPPEDSRALAKAMQDIAAQNCDPYMPHIRTLGQQFDVKKTAQDWMNKILPER
jgi:glycosyltransferase involved in cell wall biosynthesis